VGGLSVARIAFAGSTNDTCPPSELTDEIRSHYTYMKSYRPTPTCMHTNVRAPLGQASNGLPGGKLTFFLIAGAHSRRGGSGKVRLRLGRLFPVGLWGPNQARQGLGAVYLPWLHPRLAGSR
jgi:hypothetical protein